MAFVVLSVFVCMRETRFVAMTMLQALRDTEDDVDEEEPEDQA